MRSQYELSVLESVKERSQNQLSEIKVENDSKEVFIYYRGTLVAYTNQKVIEHKTDRLVNLSEFPLDD